jgi:hypothetical protein
MLKALADNVFITRPPILMSGMTNLIEDVAKTYPFEVVDRRPHLTMEFPVFFDKRDSSSCLDLRKVIYDLTMPAITEYFKLNNLSGMYPKKSFITISKLLPGEGMGVHADNKSESSNHFICMVYTNSDFSGGEIAFPELDILYKPTAGDVLIYKANILHEVLPVTSGIRYSIGYGLTDDII